jgi:hypothetical protein
LNFSASNKTFLQFIPHTPHPLILINTGFTVILVPFEPVPKEHEQTAVTPQFEQLPDPWKLELATQNNTVETQSVVLPFFTLKLLSPAKVQPKPKRTRTYKKSTDTAKSKSTKAQSQGKPKRPRTKVA